MNFLGESHYYGLASVMVCMSLKCCTLFRFTCSNIISYSSSDHYTVNVGAVLGQITTGGGADHFIEQLACVQVPSLSSKSFINMECRMGDVFEAMHGR